MERIWQASRVAAIAKRVNGLIRNPGNQEKKELILDSRGSRFVLLLWHCLAVSIDRGGEIFPAFLLS